MSKTTTEPTIGINTQVNITEQTIADVLTIGIEGGSNYWAHFDDSEKGMNKPTVLNGAINEVNPLALVAMTDGGSIDIYDAETRTEKLGQLNKIGVIKALQMMADGSDSKGSNVPTRYFNEIVGDNADAYTGDILIQLAVLGQIDYN